jgi:hypothetical protein
VTARVIESLARLKDRKGSPVRELEQLTLQDDWTLTWSIVKRAKDFQKKRVTASKPFCSHFNHSIIHRAGKGTTKSLNHRDHGRPQ